jgi:uncharacterized protein
MKNIIGRENTIHILQTALQSNQSEFVSLTGRRRIGKTYLIKNFFAEEICFYMTGVQNQPMNVQLEAFNNELMIRTNTFTGSPKNWLEAFMMLRQYVASIKTKTKKVIFLDELPWIDTQRSGFLQIFAHFWNSWAAWEHNIILVIAGSSTSWIVNKIYNDTGGLHNRVTKRIWLEPFKLAETELFFKSKNIILSHYEITLIYMALGGVPYYLNEVTQGESAAQCIQRLFFSVEGLLVNEFENLYKSIFNKPDGHIKIVKTLAKHNYGLERSELLKKSNLTNSGAATTILDELIATGYVYYMTPYGKNLNGGKYILADFYSRFYMSFVSDKKIENWISHVNTNTYKTWCGLAFEWLCHHHKAEIIKALGLSGIQTSTSYLNIKDENNKIISQIDMLIERGDNAYNLCEIKFSNDVYVLSKTEQDNIKRKINNFQDKLKRRKSIFPTMITTFGCEKNMHYLGLITNQLDLECLF